MPLCYILHSNTLNRFYIGSTELKPNERLIQHNLQLYGKNKFTATANDWEIYFEIHCNSIEQARKIERYIKKMKSSTYIRNLKIYPEFAEKLKMAYALQ